MAPVLVAVDIADPVDAWRSAGFSVAGGVVRVGAVDILLTGSGSGSGSGEGLVGWAMADVSGEGDIDGLATRVVHGHMDGGGPGPVAHPNGALRIDHVVVLTPDIARTTASFEERGFEVRRVRDIVQGRPLRQVFFRAGEVIVEVVGPAEADPGVASEPSRFFGLAITVEDLDATALLLGDSLGRIKGAVQEGRRIATVGHKALGLSTAVAFMSPPP